jgi:hypothetical protein
MRAKKKVRPTSRTDAIATEITDLLSAKGGTEKFATEVVVRSTIQFLKEIAQNKPPWGFKKSNADALSALQKNISDLRKTLSGIPGELLMLLAAKDVSGQIPSLLEQQNAGERLKKIVGVLTYLQARCDQLLEQQPGEHGSADFSQRRAAEEAWRLMKYHNLKPASGVASSDYGIIATLLFEAVTGEQDKDLQRACKTALGRAKKGELNDWRGGPSFSQGELAQLRLGTEK